MLYFAFVHPHILYGIEVYANTYHSTVNRLVVLNNKILRILQNEGIQTRVVKLYCNYFYVTSVASSYISTTCFCPLIRSPQISTARHLS